MSTPFAARLGVSALAATTAWVALWSWGGLVEEPGRFLTPALLGAIIVAGVGSVGRSLRWPSYGVLAAQVVVLLVWLDHRYAADGAWAGWIPTWSSIGVLVGRVHDGAVAVNRFAAPVSSDHAETYVYLLAASVLVLLATDFLACGLRRVPWAGLPVIVTLTIPISVLESRLSWVVFVGTSMLFIMLLATEQTARVLGWGRLVAGRGERIDSLDQVVNGSTVRGAAARIGVVAAVGAMVVPVFVPISSGLFKGGNGAGPGNGRNGSVTLRNPIVDLRRDLLTQQHIPLVEARTTADPSYLRLTVLDQFNGVEWLPSPRNLAKGNDADGAFPPAPGLARDTAGTEAEWTLRLDDRFDTTWLPAPYPTRRMSIPRGDWRYDLRTLDVASVDRPATSELQYQAVGFTPRLSPARMQSALTAPPEILTPMTSVPGNRPSVVTRIAEEVTAGATTDYDRMVLLQNWFRNTGGFSYSLTPSPGSGISELVRFLTTDKIGYCEQFAAAMAVMARALGIPARVAVGFLAPHPQADGSLLYTSDDLHAWPEIYFSGSGWVAFEPTPSSRTGAPPAWTTGGSPRTPTAGPSITAAPSAVPTTPNRRTPQDSSSTSSSGNAATEVAVAVALALVLLVLALPRLVRGRQRRRRLAALTEGVGGIEATVLADGAWQELLATARDLRIDLPVRRSVRDVAGVLRRRALPGSDALGQLDTLVDFVERARYGRRFLTSPETHRAIVAAVEAWADVLAASVPASRARIARVFPRSAFDRDLPTPSVERPLEMAGTRELD